MKKKTLVMLLCAAMTIGSVAFGTIAYLMDSHAVTNTFTIGNVDIIVDESKVNGNGEYIDENGKVVDKENAERTEEGNEYHLVPGKSYPKDPTMTVVGTSESCYVRMMVTINCAKELEAICKEMTAKNPQKYPNALPQDHVSGYDANVWVFEKATADEAGNAVTYEFRYFEAVDPDGEDIVLAPVFTAINVPGEIRSEQLSTMAGLEIVVEGQAIQTAVFENDDEAWTAFDEQYLTVEDTQNAEEAETAEDAAV